MRPAYVSIPALPCLLLAAAGCSPMRMAVPQEVSSVSEEIVITDRSSMSGALADESFTMGPYQVVNVDRKWNSSSGFTTASFSAGSTKGGYSYGLKTQGGEYRGQCASQVDIKSVGFLGGTLGNQNLTVICECSGAGQASVVLTADTSSQYRGSMSARGASYPVNGIYERDKGGSSSTPTGYAVHGAAPVGAVEVVGKGRVWMNKSLDPALRSDIACIFAGLLLYQPPREN